MRYAIEEWNIKDRRWAIIHECDECHRRYLRTAYMVQCARYPNNSFRLVEIAEKVLDERCVHRDAQRAQEQEGGAKE